MATKSFIKSVSLRNAKQCQAFIRALEKSESAPVKKEEAAQPVHEMSVEQIRKIFGTKDN